jgi:hypothetical protein
VRRFRSCSVKTEAKDTLAPRLEVKTEMDPNFCENWKEAVQAAALDRIKSLGDLYFIQAGNAVKIGRTANIVGRLGKMQADNHEELNCLLVLPGQGHEESDYQERFAEHRIRGEWFRLCPEILEEVARLRMTRRAA